ncbi:MAG: urea ABC transporter ATP-binding protein UrtD [Clostridia bacterium]
MAFLELKNLTVEFSGFRAVNEVDLSIEKGELRVIIGPNGAGKTTIIDMITGKTKPTYGSIMLDGENIAGKDAYKISSKYKIGRKFQGPNVFDYMTVYENIEVSLSGYSSLMKTFFFKNNADTRAEIDDILKKINLYEQKDIFPTYLSHGQRQWLEIGMVLAQKPEIITLDEPTAGMTADETYKTGELIKTVMKDKTVIVIEHDIDFVKQIAQKVTVLSQGEVLAEGSYEEITSNPEVIRVYLKSDDEE